MSFYKTRLTEGGSQTSETNCYSTTSLCNDSVTHDQDDDITLLKQVAQSTTANGAVTLLSKFTRSKKKSIKLKMPQM